MTNILVTGGSGFIGSHLVDALLEKQYKIYCIVRDVKNLKWLQNKPVELIKADLCSPNMVMPEVDYIFHLAGLTKAKKRQQFYKANYEGTVNLLRCIKKQKKPPKGFFLLSTLAVNGDINTITIKANDPATPQSHYAKSKWMAEQEALKYKDLMDVVIIRPTAVYGPRDRELFSYFKLVKKYRFAPIINKDGIYSFLYVKDLINMLLLLLEHNVPSGQIFLMSDGNGYKWSEVVEKISSQLKITARPVVIYKFLVYFFAMIISFLNLYKKEPFILTIDKLKEIFKKSWICDIMEVRDILRFEPKYNLDEGLGLTINWYKTNRWL